MLIGAIFRLVLIVGIVGKCAMKMRLHKKNTIVNIRCNGDNIKSAER